MFSQSIVVQKHSNVGGSYGESSISSDFTPPVHGGSSLLRVATGCDGDGGGGGSSSPLKSWAQQMEESYQLQLALALRLSWEAASVDDPNSLDPVPDESSSSRRLSSSASAESISHRFWVTGCLSYSDKIPDGFYLIHGMDPYVWNVCSDLQNTSRIPSIDSLQSLDPRYESAVEVVVIDRRTDSNLKEMQNIVHSITFNCLSPDAVVDQLAQLVCNRMGGVASTREDEFVPVWEKISDGLKYCLGSVVLPIGSLSIGLCRHRALLFKALADTIDLPCRIAKGCKYCNRHDATSCIVRFGLNREYSIDLIGKPGCKSEPDSLLNGPYSILISSPLHFLRFRPVEIAIDLRSLAEHYFSDCQSLNRVFKGPSSGAIVEQPGLELPDWNNPIHSKINNAVHPAAHPIHSHFCESSSAQQNRRVPNVTNRIVPTVFFPAGRPRGTEQYYVGANGNAFNSRSETSQLVSSRHSSEVSLDMNDLVISWSDLVVQDRIGAGSFGTVHRAEWNGSEVAVKILMEQDLHPENCREFLREVAIMKNLRHPNIVLFMGAVTEPPKLAIVTEYLSRGSLFRLLHKSGGQEVLDERRRLSMAYDVANGMNYLHRRSPPIVHRDLKSPNLLVDKKYTVKVGDFGLSRLKANTFLSSKTAAGTPEWMAPEVLRAELSNEKSDVYSFGVILWELATLQRPWSNLNPFQVVATVAYERKRMEIPHYVNPQVATLIEACWANDPRERPAFSEIMEFLRSLLDATAPQSGHGHSQYRT